MDLKKLLTLLLGWLPLWGFGQEYHSSVGFTFVKELPITQAGVAYRYQVSIRSRPADTTAAVRFWAMQKGKNEYDFKKTDRPTEAIRPGEWHTYAIESQLVPGTKKLWVYVVLAGNGTFLFANQTLQVQAPDQSWQSVAVKQPPAAPGPGASPLAGYLLDPALKNQLPAGVVAASAPGQGPAQEPALRLTLSGGTLVKSAVLYGHNKAVGKYCQLPGVKLYYETYGAGEPLLLLHGNGESISSFQKQIAVLAKQYQVVAVDTRAQGRSVDTLTTPLTYELFAADAKTLLDSLHLPKASILGWSDGGNTGLLMALRYPTYVSKLVTMGANLFPTTEAVDAKLLRQSEQARQALAKKGDVAHERLLTLVLTEPHMRYAELAAIQAPVLVLAGEKDIIKQAHTQAIAAHIPHARVVILKGATHYAPQEDPALFNETVLRFLAEK